MKHPKELMRDWSNMGLKEEDGVVKNFAIEEGQRAWTKRDVVLAVERLAMVEDVNHAAAAVLGQADPRVPYWRRDYVAWLVTEIQPNAYAYEDPWAFADIENDPMGFAWLQPERPPARIRQMVGLDDDLDAFMQQMYAKPKVPPKPKIPMNAYHSTPLPLP